MQSFHFGHVSVDIGDGYTVTSMTIQVAVYAKTRLTA
jgi:hypothetical protein